MEHKFGFENILNNTFFWWDSWKEKREDLVNFSPILEEFADSCGEKGILQGPNREKIHPVRPFFSWDKASSFEGNTRWPNHLHNNLYEESATGMARMWNLILGHWQSLLHWSIPFTGDEDTTPFMFFHIEESPTTCLFSNAAHNIIFST